MIIIIMIIIITIIIIIIITIIIITIIINKLIKLLIIKVNEDQFPPNRKNDNINNYKSQNNIKSLK
jgi:hypothetical protein